MTVEGPGYYRVLLHERGSLEGRYEGLRIVREGIQVPFFMDRGEPREVALTLNDSHDAEANRTTWAFELPQMSDRWITLRVKAKGVFRREVALERDAPGPSGNPVIEKKMWQQTADREGEMRFTLQGHPVNETRLRIVMTHGDNTPLKLEGAWAEYRVPALYFLANHPGGYEVYGGSKTAGAAKYDLQLVVSELMAQEPQLTQLGDPQPFADQGGWAGKVAPWLESRWAFYAALGLITIVLVGIVVRLFPARPSSPPPPPSEGE